MRKTALTALFLLLVLAGQAQVYVRPALHAGYGLNPGLKLYDEPVLQPHGFVSEAGLQVEFMLFKQKRFSLALVPAVRYIRNAGQSVNSSFVTHTSRGVFSAWGAFTQLKWKLYAGGSVQHNRDFNDFIPNQEDNYRFNALSGFDFAMTDHLVVGARYTQSLSKVGDPYFVMDPQYSLMIGLSYTLHKLSEK